MCWWNVGFVPYGEVEYAYRVRVLNEWWVLPVELLSMYQMTFVGYVKSGGVEYVPVELLDVGTM